jgi:serine/threonine-protein kinase
VVACGDGYGRVLCGALAEEWETGMKLGRFVLVLIGAVLLFGAGLLAFNFVIMPRLIHRNTVVLVPDLRGQTLADAQVETQRLGLKVRQTRQRPHPTVMAGKVLDQTPTAASPIRRGRTVQVVTSSGPPAGLLADLTGLTRRQAEITLQRESYRLGRILKIRRPEVTVPTVIYQYPPGGVVLRKGKPVALVVAEPTLPTSFRMPDFQGVSLFVAREKIAAAGCVAASVSFERNRDVAPNTVLSQSPRPGARIRKGARVELVAATR